MPGFRGEKQFVARTVDLPEAQASPEVALEEVLEAEGEKRGEGGEDEGPGVDRGQTQARVRQDARRITQHVDVAGRYDDTCMRVAASHTLDL